MSALLQDQNEFIDEWLAKAESVASILPFKEQDAFVYDPAQFLALLCTRRAGKTSGLARKFKRTMDKYPGSLSRYIALTRDSAKDIMWGVLQEMDEHFKWGCRFHERALTMIAPNDAKLRLYGADMRNFVRRLRGSKSPANAVDEAQEFDPEHLENLVDDILTPTMVDYPESWLALAGTPGPIPRGMYFRVTEENAGEYAVHKWSLYQNPYLADAKGFVENLKRRKGWTDLTPTYRREYCGLWAIDQDALFIKYNERINHYDSPPPRKGLIYVLGVDIGFRDSDALAVLGWSERSKNIHLIEEVVTATQDISALAAQIDRIRKLYDISKIVMDTGGLGKKVAEEIIRRHQIPVQAADKTRKMENAALLNDWLRLGNFKAKKESRFAKDSYLVHVDYEKSTPDRLVLKSTFHSDIIDAVLYAFRECPAFTYQPEVKKPKWGSKEWADEQVTEMERLAEEHFKQQEGDDWESYAF